MSVSIEVEEIPENFKAFWRKAFAENWMTIKFVGMTEDGIGESIAFIVPCSAVQVLDDRLVMTMSEENARAMAKDILESKTWEPAP